MLELPVPATFICFPMLNDEDMSENAVVAVEIRLEMVIETKPLATNALAILQ